MPNCQRMCQHQASHALPGNCARTLASNKNALGQDVAFCFDAEFVMLIHWASNSFLKLYPLLQPVKPCCTSNSTLENLPFRVLYIQTALRTAVGLLSSTLGCPKVTDPQGTHEIGPKPPHLKPASSFISSSTCPNLGAPARARRTSFLVANGVVSCRVGTKKGRKNNCRRTERQDANATNARGAAFLSLKCPPWKWVRTKTLL